MGIRPVHALSTASRSPSPASGRGRAFAVVGERLADVAAVDLVLGPGFVGEAGPVGVEAEVVADVGDDVADRLGHDVAVDVVVLQPLARRAAGPADLVAVQPVVGLGDALDDAGDLVLAGDGRVGGTPLRR